MKEEQKKKIAAFRFSVISDLAVGVYLDKEELRELIRQKAKRQWDIPYSDRSTISETTIKRWLDTYQENNQNITSLYPKSRNDSGSSRAIDDETAATLFKMHQSSPKLPITELLYSMEQSGLLLPGRNPSLSTVYRFLHNNGGLKDTSPKVDRRRFEAGYPNDIWQSDVMHGPKIKINGKRQKSYLIAFIDDHSRLVPHAAFYPQENLKYFLLALKRALSFRGIPRKLYVDNGPAYRSNQLEFIAASLQINLIHATPYTPQGKGKIERFFRTIRSHFLTDAVVEEVDRKDHPLMELNEKLSVWLMDRYHKKVHVSIGETPLNRFQKGIEMIRPVPDNLDDHFRLVAIRKVTKDRVVHLEGKLYEAPVDLVGERIELLYHSDSHFDVEARFQGKSYGKLKLLDLGINVRVRRGKNNDQILFEEIEKPVSKPGQLFNKPRRKKTGEDK